MFHVRLFSRSRTVSCWSIVTIGLIWNCATIAQAAEKSSDAKSPESAIRASADEFVKAFDRGDAKAVAALWTANGTETDEQGEVFQGRPAIEKQYAAFFKAQPKARIEVSIESIDVATPAVAIEDGVASVTNGDNPPTASRYRAVHVLENGKWLMASVREALFELVSLQQLAWLIGKWETKSEDTVVQSDIHWIVNKTFIQRDYTAQKGKDAISAGTQIVGVDPQSGQLRCWSFDSSGGHGTGLWSAVPAGWQIDNVGVLADGTPTMSRDLIIRVAGEDSIFGWRSIERRVGQMPLPDTKEVVLERVPE